MVDRVQITQATNEEKLTVRLITRLYTGRGVNTRDLQPSVGYYTRLKPAVRLYTRINTGRGVNTRDFNLFKE